MKFLLLFTIIPLAAAFLTALLGRRLKDFSFAFAGLAALILLGFSLYSIKLVHLQNILVYKIGGWIPPLGICLVVDGFAVFMLTVVNLVCLLVMVYSCQYMKAYTDNWKFYSLFMLMLAGLNGIIISGDLFNLYVFVELASISAYVLVAFGIEPEDLEASFKYAIMGSLASIFILLGIVLLYSYTSTLNMADMALVLSAKPTGFLTAFVTVLFIAGFGLKAALVPFHAWLPDAHSTAPTPVSAVLSGVFIKTLGIYAFCRVFFNILGVSDKLLLVLMILGILSMVVGALLAIVQNDIKRMFAYSSISQIGYIAFALGIGTPLAILGALFYLFNHAISKSMLFLNSGIIEQATGTRKLDKLGGLNNKMPAASFSSLIGSMNISGIPPLGGFWAKLLIIIAAIQSGLFAFAIIAVLVSILTLAYYLKFQTFTFSGKLDKAFEDIKGAALTMKVPSVILAVICLLAGLMLIPAFKPFLDSAVEVLVSGANYKDAFFAAIK